MVKKIAQKKRVWLAVGAILLLLIILFRVQIRSAASFLFGVTIDKNIHLAQEKNTFNVLIMGIAGGKHDGPKLTDTIILANINVSEKKINLFSIPRDLWISELSHKINYAYPYGEEENKGIAMSRTVVEKVTGQKIDYVFVIDFAGFSKVVDHLGGIDVNVEKTFQDSLYPITGEEDNPCGHTDEELVSLATVSADLEVLEAFPCRYKLLSFKKGLTTMDGATALEYVRSRHGNNKEGSDFARSRRQQEVISALKDKAFSLGVILNPVKVYGVFNIIQENINTDIQTDEFDDFIKLANKMKTGTIQNNVIDYGDESADRNGLLIEPRRTEKYAFQSVLTPRKGEDDFTEIHEYVQCIISGKVCEVGKNSIVIMPTPTK